MPAEYHELQLRPYNDHPENDLTMHAPPGMEENCNDVRVQLVEVPDGGTVTILRFKLDDLQKAYVENGGHVVLQIWQHPMPPVSLHMEGPPCPSCGEEMTWDENLQSFNHAHDVAEEQVPGGGDNPDGGGPDVTGT